MIPTISDTSHLNVDIFNLSIISSLSLRLLDFPIHPNLGSVATVLGRRLLFATRQAAAVRMKAHHESRSVHSNHRRLASVHELRRSDHEIQQPLREVVLGAAQTMPSLFDGGWLGNGSMEVLEGEAQPFDLNASQWRDIFPFLDGAEEGISRPEDMWDGAIGLS
jgi:hypothetical protein